MRKKLRLSSETLRVLSEGQARRVVGGATVDSCDGGNCEPTATVQVCGETCANCGTNASCPGQGGSCDLTLCNPPCYEQTVGGSCGCPPTNAYTCANCITDRTCETACYSCGCPTNPC